MERVAHPSSGRRSAIEGAGSLVVSGAALGALLLFWAVAWGEPRGTNTPAGGLLVSELPTVPALGLVGAGLLLARVVRSSRRPRRKATGTWIALVVLVVVQLLLSWLAWYLITSGSSFDWCDQRPLLPGVYLAGQALGLAGATWSARLAGSEAGGWIRAAVLAAGVAGAGVLVLGMVSSPFVLSVVNSSCPP
jgi:hypothetical protein